MAIRLVLRPEVRKEAEEAGLEAAFRVNEGELSYHAESLVHAAVEAVLRVIEERQG